MSEGANDHCKDSCIRFWKRPDTHSRWPCSISRSEIGGDSSSSVGLRQLIDNPIYLQKECGLARYNIEIAFHTPSSRSWPTRMFRMNTSLISFPFVTFSESKTYPTSTVGASSHGRHVHHDITSRVCGPMTLHRLGVKEYRSFLKNWNCRKS